MFVCGWALAACARGDAVETSAEDAAASGEETRIGCEFGPFFPASALDTAPPLIEDSDVPEVADAIASFLTGGEGEAGWPQQNWRVLEVVPEDRVQLVHPGDAAAPHLAFMSASWEDGLWRWSGAGIPGSCALMLEPDDASGTVEWVLDPAGPAPDASSTEVTLLATEQGCASGQPMGDRLNPPNVSMTADAVLIELNSRLPEGDAQTCPGNPSQSVVVTLPEPLGDRELRDARTTDLGELRTVLLELIDAE